MSGIFGCIAKENCVNDIFYGTDYLSHLGTKRGGIAVLDSKEFKRSIHSLENSYFRPKFEVELSSLAGNSGIGVISDYEDQPILMKSHLGTFGLVTVSKINNIEELTKKALKIGRSFSEISLIGMNPTELIAMLITERNSFQDGISYAQEVIKGSCTLMLLTDRGIYAARDRLGRTPLVVGGKEGAGAVSSESCAFPNLGYEVKKELGPGEVVLVTSEGYEQLKKPGEKMQICTFLWVYYGFPASTYEGLNVEDARYRCGAKLALDDDVKADFVAGIPDSGSAHGIGYANARGLMYKRPIVKYTPTWPRSFMPQNQRMRDLVAKMKLIPIKELITGRKILFCEDSIVRGTQLQDNVKYLFELGIKEFHMRPACPTLTYPCEFLNFSQSRSTLDLAGRLAIKNLTGSEFIDLKKFAEAGSSENLAMVENIRDRLGLTSLKFQRLEDLVGAIGLSKEKLCTHCWDESSYF